MSYQRTCRVPYSSRLRLTTNLCTCSLRRLEEKCTEAYEAQKDCLKNTNLKYHECRDQERALKKCWRRVNYQPPAEEEVPTELPVTVHEPQKS